MRAFLRKVRLTWSPRNPVSKHWSDTQALFKPSHLSITELLPAQSQPIWTETPCTPCSGLPSHTLHEIKPQRTQLMIHLFLSHRECNLMVFPWANVCSDIEGQPSMKAGQSLVHYHFISLKMAELLSSCLKGYAEQCISFCFFHKYLPGECVTKLLLYL